MFKKKLLTALLATVVAATPNAVHATAGEWDPVDVDHYFGTASKTVHSQGGDFMVCLNQYETWSGYITLWEHDVENADDPAGSERYLSANQCAIWRGISGYLDGDNNLAEFYVRRSSASDFITVVFYD